MSKKLSFKIKKDNFPDLVSKLKDISNINEVVKMKINKDNILMYAMKANDAAVLALKSYNVPTINYIEDFNEEETYDFIIVDTPKFIKKLNFFDVNIPLKLDITSKPHFEEKDVMQIRTAQFTNGKLKIQAVGGEDSKIRNIDSESLDSRTDIENSEWRFKISKEDFLDIKKLSSIDSEERILSINIENGKVIAGEDTKWELYVGEASKNINYKIIFNKKYLSNINQNKDIIDFYMFETFVLVKDEESNLMLSFEQTYEYDEET